MPRNRFGHTFMSNSRVADFVGQSIQTVPVLMCKTEERGGKVAYLQRKAPGICSFAARESYSDPSLRREVDDWFAPRLSSSGKDTCVGLPLLVFVLIPPMYGDSISGWTAVSTLWHYRINLASITTNGRRGRIFVSKVDEPVSNWWHRYRCFVVDCSGHPRLCDISRDVFNSLSTYLPRLARWSAIFSSCEVVNGFVVSRWGNVQPFSTFSTWCRNLAKKSHVPNTLSCIVLPNDIIEDK